MKSDCLLRIKQVAKRLNRNPRYVYYLIDYGLLPALSIGSNGKGLRVKNSDLERLIEKRSCEYQEKTGFIEYCE